MKVTLPPVGMYTDPGVDAMACAVFVGFDLAILRFFDAESFASETRYWPEAFAALRDHVIEKPQINRQTDGKDPNDLIELAIALGRFDGSVRAAGGPAASFVTPNDWKGSIKKPIHHRRVWDALAAHERQIVATAIGMTPEAIEKKIVDACARLARTGKVTGYSWAAHNLLDAVGLGLWHLGRLGRGGVRR